MCDSEKRIRLSRIDRRGTAQSRGQGQGNHLTDWCMVVTRNKLNQFQPLRWERGDIALYVQDVFQARRIDITLLHQRHDDTGFLPPPEGDSDTATNVRCEQTICFVIKQLRQRYWQSHSNNSHPVTISFNKAFKY